MNKQQIFTLSFLFLFISNFLIFIGFEMLLPILPAYLVSLNANPMQVGGNDCVYNRRNYYQTFYRLLFNRSSAKKSSDRCMYIVINHYDVVSFS